MSHERTKQRSYVLTIDQKGASSLGDVQFKSHVQAFLAHHASRLRYIPPDETPVPKPIKFVWGVEAMTSGNVANFPSRVLDAYPLDPHIAVVNIKKHPGTGATKPG